MKSAHWIQRTHLFRVDEYICSACRVSCKKPYKECPSCGALMKKAKYESPWADEAEGLTAILDEE